MTADTHTDGRPTGAALSDGSPMVTFRRSGRSVRWNPAAESLLDFAEQQELSPPFCCRAGVCSTCVTRIFHGRVVYHEVPVVTPPDGWILLCSTKPVTSVELDL
jgi:ferredoxin